MSPNYQNAKLYKIISEIGKCCYIGSTTQNLNKRFIHHKNHKKTTSRYVFEFPDACIVLLELFPCENKKELEVRERYYIETDTCVNKQIPSRSLEEFKLKKKEYNAKPEVKLKQIEYNAKPEVKLKKKEYDATPEVKLKKKEYNAKPEVKARNNEHYICNCGGKYTFKHKSEHIKSTKHKKYELSQIVN